MNIFNKPTDQDPGVKNRNHNSLEQLRDAIHATRHLDKMFNEIYTELHSFSDDVEMASLERLYHRIELNYQQRGAMKQLIQI